MCDRPPVMFFMFFMWALCVYRCSRYKGEYTRLSILINETRVAIMSNTKMRVSSFTDVVHTRV